METCLFDFKFFTEENYGSEKNSKGYKLAGMMLTSIRSIIAVSLPIFLFCSKVDASELRESNNMITYASFVDAVIINYPERSIWQRNVDLTRQRERRAGILPDPEIALSREGISFDSLEDVEAQDQAVDATMTPRWEMTVTQRFPWPGTLAAAVTASQTEGEIAELNLLQREAALRLEAAEFFMQLVAISKTIEIEHKNLQETNKIFELASERFKQGTGSYADVLQARIEKINLQADIDSQIDQFENLKLQARLLMGRRNDNKQPFDLSFPDWVEAGFPTDKSTKDFTASNINLANRRDKAMIETQYRESLPMFMTSGMVMQTDNGMRSYGGMLGIQVPLFSGIKRRSLSSEETLVQSQFQDSLLWYEEKKQVASSQIARRISRAMKNIKTLSDELSPLAQENLQVAMQIYGAGGGTATSLIEARRSLLRVETAKVSASYELAMARLAARQIELGFVDAVIGSPIARPQSQLGMGSSGMPQEMPMRPRGQIMQREPVAPRATEDMQPMGRGGAM